MRTIYACLVMALALTFVIPAHADTQLDTAQNELELTAQSYKEAQDKYSQIQSEIASNEKRLKELQDQLPQLQENAGRVIHQAYKMGKDTPNLLSIILSSDNLSDFLSTMHQMQIMQNKYMQSIKDLNDAQAELMQKSEELSKKKDEASQTLQQAENALAAAIDARVAAQKAADEKIQSEKAEAQAAVEAAREASSSTFTPANSEASTPVEVPKSATTGPVDWSIGRDAFISTWTSRINAYLSGSPMAGTGRAFAEAAWDTGVDPRWSPAIATAESSKGYYVPYGNSNNAWGWTARGGGFRRFSSFEEGARAHVHYLANMYGTTHTPSAARIYVGSGNWSYWYSSVLAQMESM